MHLETVLSKNALLICLPDTREKVVYIIKEKYRNQNIPNGSQSIGFIS